MTVLETLGIPRDFKKGILGSLGIPWDYVSGIIRFLKDSLGIPYSRHSVGIP